MRLDSLSVHTQPLQNSNNNRDTTENKAVVQVNRLNQSRPSKDENERDVITAIDKLNDFMEPLNTSLKFELHEELNEYYVAIVNPDTNEVVKEIPPKKILDMYAAMGEFMGFLFDKKI
ncbi:flagellar protein FlaG [Ornithinibacillus halotolerans]|uniref:Flagellar protein FlaG n=1 Tax=Ornithinibacillus halotolerans TaxID=1274357 RepID=A0A916RTU0_9BACI|nr:flagellar protein FlaG [Ornithinibacillus halotolerans]GGA67211.1 hypothetical protein GCM10008025_08820 [Ornithinibacillus halotolerans]